MAEYGRIHTDGSRSGGQPVVATQKAHTMVLEVLAEWGIALRHTTAQQLAVATTEALCRAIDQLEDLRQSTQSDTLQADIDAMQSILWVDTIIDDKEAIAKAFARHRQRGYEAGVKAAAKALLADAKLCDCAALEERECACGAWDDYKSITSARAVEIVRALQGQSK